MDRLTLEDIGNPEFKDRQILFEGEVQHLGATIELLACMGFPMDYPAFQERVRGIVRTRILSQHAAGMRGPLIDSLTTDEKNPGEIPFVSVHYYNWFVFFLSSFFDLPHCAAIAS